jgi:hypothetical protein
MPGPAGRLQWVRAAQIGVSKRDANLEHRTLGN